MRVRNLTLMAMLVAFGVLASRFVYIPVGAAKAYPVQHLINVLAAVLLGPGPAVGIALMIGAIRNLLGTGTILAFPGGMVGAILASYLYRWTRRTGWALIGEVFGTGVLGALLAFPLARIVLGKDVAAFFFVIPFSLSSLMGALLALPVLAALRRADITGEGHKTPDSQFSFMKDGAGE